MNNNMYIGVDNGINGALVTLKNNKIIDKTIMPIISSSKNKKIYDIQNIIKYFEKYLNAIVILEKAHAMPIIGKVQAFEFGKGYGIIIGIISTLKMSYQIVHAKTWQKEMFRDASKKDTKQTSILIAQRLFPTIDFRASKKSKKMHDGITDATLIAMYGSRCM